jgi:hypothetical protein
VDSAPRSQRGGSKKQNKKAGRKENEERQRARTLDREIAEGKHCHSSDPREEQIDSAFSIYIIAGSMPSEKFCQRGSSKKNTQKK